MKIALIVISIVLVAIVLLQPGAEGNDGSFTSGGNSDLFANRKERGGELFMTRFTCLLGIAFMVICAIL
jgi:preprotein translocase subunit SecG